MQHLNFMAWLNLLAAPGCLILGMLIALYVKDSARETAKTEFATLIVAALSQFKLELLQELSDTYRRSGECDLMMSPLEDRVDILNRRADAHDARFESLPKHRVNGGCDASASERD